MIVVMLAMALVEIAAGSTSGGLQVLPEMSAAVAVVKPQGSERFISAPTARKQLASLENSDLR